MCFSSSSLCCEVEFWTSWSHNSRWNLKTPKSAITRFAPPTVVVSWVWVTRPEWTQYSIHHHKSFIFRVHDVPRVLFEDGFHFWWSLYGSLFLHIWRKKDVTEEEKDLLCWSSIAVLRATKSSRFTCFNVSRNVRYTLLLYIRSLSCPKLTAMFFYDSSDIWLKWPFIGDIIYHNMWYKMKRMFPKISLSIVNLGFVCFPNIK